MHTFAHYLLARKEKGKEKKTRKRHFSGPRKEKKKK
jgi:hypothetical protein